MRSKAMRLAAFVAALGIASIAMQARAGNKPEKDEKETSVTDLRGIFHEPPPNEIGVRLPTRTGVTEPFMFAAPASPKAVVILFPGGEGAVDIVGEGQSATVKRWGNFLIRARAKFVAAGIATVALDVPSDHSDGIDEAFRKGADHAADVNAGNCLGAAENQGTDLVSRHQHGHYFRRFGRHPTGQWYRWRGSDLDSHRRRSQFTGARRFDA